MAGKFELYKDSGGKFRFRLKTFRQAHLTASPLIVTSLAAVGRLHLSARAIHRALRVARTIADLAKSERVLSSHLSEALSFRPTTTSPISCPIEQG